MVNGVWERRKAIPWERHESIAVELKGASILASTEGNLEEKIDQFLAM